MSTVARRFHDTTAHSPYSVRTSGHTLDWDNKPFPFKVYTDTPSIALPRDVDVIGTPTLAALATAAPPASRLTLSALTALLYYTAGVTKKKTYPGGGEVLFRAAASTGALYQTEVYVIAGEVDGLEAGLYHFCPGDFTLRRLRTGDVRQPLAAAAADPSIGRRAASLVLTGIYWRNTWKYQARGFRHLYWDSGTMLANALAVGGALGLAPALVTGFVDDDVNRLLGVDPELEAALELLVVGPAGAAAPPAGAPPPLSLDVMPLSGESVDYPALREMQQASHLASPAAVEAWRRASVPTQREPSGAPVPLPPPARGGRALAETIQGRGSTRTFGHAALSAQALADELWAATLPVPADVPSGLVDLYVIVNAVDDVAPGAYAYRPGHGLTLIRAGEFRREAAYLTLEQALGGDAAATFFFLAPLDALLAAWGERGYRLANLEAGIAGGRAYLVAYASGFGATGLTFYDADVVRFFSPHAAGRDAIFVTALGRPGSTQRGVLLSNAIQPPTRRS
ncbi:MAG TPA: SagB/ThcOx family dehydrogenase [Methylomirabilota bacterium]|nr:SagB/ThcOx family dehydrogenase [Methylomirabilota bacterium]